LPNKLGGCRPLRPPARYAHENNPRKHLYNISKSLPRKTAYSLSYIRIE
jgi:hypothetical protein